MDSLLALNVTNAGIEYGTATDGRRIYAAEADTAGLSYCPSSPSGAASS